MHTDAPIYQSVHDAIQRVTEADPVINPMHSINDIRNPLLSHGIPTVGYGPLAAYGVDDEWVDVDDYLRAIEVTARVIVGWSG